MIVYYRTGNSKEENGHWHFPKLSRFAFLATIVYQMCMIPAKSSLLRDTQMCGSLNVR